MPSSRPVVRPSSAAVLLAVLAACDPFGSGRMKERMAARTAEAPVSIDRADTVSVFDDDEMDTTPDRRHNVWYSFTVDGQVRRDSLMSTLYIPAERYKVCFDPRDPANSSIELADIGCGKTF